MTSDSLTVFSSRQPKYEAHRPSPAIHQVIVGGDYKRYILGVISGWSLEHSVAVGSENQKSDALKKNLSLHSKKT